MVVIVQLQPVLLLLLRLAVLGGVLRLLKLGDLDFYGLLDALAQLPPIAELEKKLEPDEEGG